MCLITDQERPFIPEEDITVYKTLTKDLKSPYYGMGVFPNLRIDAFQYELDKVYKTEIKETSDTSCFDSKDTQDCITAYGRFKLRTGVRSFGAGFHFALEASRLKDDKKYLYENELVVVECTIPKGSEFYTNISGLGVTNQIIINRILAE